MRAFGIIDPFTTVLGSHRGKFGHDATWTLSEKLWVKRDDSLELHASFIEDLAQLAQNNDKALITAINQGGPVHTTAWPSWMLEFPVAHAVLLVIEEQYTAYCNTWTEEFIGTLGDSVNLDLSFAKNNIRVLERDRFKVAIKQHVEKGTLTAVQDGHEIAKRARAGELARAIGREFYVNSGKLLEEMGFPENEIPRRVWEQAALSVTTGAVWSRTNNYSLISMNAMSNNIRNAIHDYLYPTDG